MPKTWVIIALMRLDFLSAERSVNEAIKQLQLTRIIVAHRPDTIAMAYRVIDLREGKVARDQVVTGQ